MSGDPSNHTTDGLDEAVRSLRAIILAGESYRQVIARVTGLGSTETQAISYLAVYGSRGQNELMADLQISSGAATALVDRLERQGVAERYAHPHDRRRTLVRLTVAGQSIVQLSRRRLARSFRSFAPDELPAVSRVLQQVADDLRAASDGAADADDCNGPR